MNFIQNYAASDYLSLGYVEFNNAKARSIGLDKENNISSYWIFTNIQIYQ